MEYCIQLIVMYTSARCAYELWYECVLEIRRFKGVFLQQHENIECLPITTIQYMQILLQTQTQTWITNNIE